MSTLETLNETCYGEEPHAFQPFLHRRYCTSFFCPNLHYHQRRWCCQAAICFQASNVDMNTRERLREAYENVSFNADKTWTETSSLYQKRSLELYLTEKVLKLKLQEKSRPRTVRESIPWSRLARYSNYDYHESREMSYAPSNSNTNLNYQTTSLVPSEPWEMLEVDDLFRWFLKNRNGEDFFGLENCYESPLMAVNSFEDSILKVQVSQDRVKEIWEKHQKDWTTNEITVNIYLSLLRNFLVIANNVDDNRKYEWFKNVSITKDFEDLQKLSKKLKEQSELLVAAPAAEVSSEILYSEVLQGLLASKKMSSSSKTEQLKTVQRNQVDSGLTQKTILKSHQVREAKNSFLPSTSTEQNNSLKTDYWQTLRTNQILPVTVSNRITPSVSTYVQQTYYCSPLLQCQRWIPATFSQLPQITTSSLWCSQNDSQPVGQNIETSKFYSAKKVLESSLYSTEAKYFFNDLNNGNAFIEEVIFDDHQVSASTSEELETQALEQYHSSNDNFYQQLERQAKEQYGSSSD